MRPQTYSLWSFQAPVAGIHSVATYCRLMICTCYFLHVFWVVETFPCYKADALRVKKKLLENVIPLGDYFLQSPVIEAPTSLDESSEP